MKKLIWTTAAVLALLFAPCTAWAQTSAASYYVSAAGNDQSDGLSEATAYKSLYRTIEHAKEGSIKKITVIGTLDERNEWMSNLWIGSVGTVFACFGGDDKTEITITGKPAVTGAERAVLSAKGSRAGVLYVDDGIQIRLEHIEISGGENADEEKLRAGINIAGEGTRVTLGPGAVVRGNESFGIIIDNGSSCVIDGGEIRDNADVGVAVLGALTLRNGAIVNNKSTGNGGGVLVGDGRFTMSGGSITGNAATDAGGGVFVGEGGTFTMSGGSITGNTAGVGGGIAVARGGSFNQTGGTASGNRATRGSNPDIYAAPGATVNVPRSSSASSAAPRPASPPRQAEGSLSGGSSSSGETPPPAQSRPRSPSVDFGFTSHLNVYVQGWHQNLASFGIPLQLGVELELPVLTLDLLGEASAGMGYGNLFEYHLGGMAELYFFDKRIGLGGGAGFYGSAFNLGLSAGGSDDEGPIINYAPPIKTMYYRFALIFRGEYKTSLYAERYGDGNWGFGLMWGRVLTD